MFLVALLAFLSGGRGEKITLFDLISPHSTQRLFDTLSASVSSEYSGREIAFDASTLPKYEDRPVNLTKLNEKYRDYLYQGDMLILPDRLDEIVDSSTKKRRLKRKAFVNREYPNTIWHQGVPYTLHWTLSRYARDSIIRAINFWQTETCIEFRPRRNEAQYVEFIGNDDGCWSTVGRDAELGRQIVSIGLGCEHFGVTSHELAHALGVFHEQSRFDRDGVVNLNPNVVDPSLLFNFAKIPPSEMNLYSLPYDVGSVMHYTPTEFSRYRNVPALSTVDPNLQQTMGQLEGPSFLDVAILNRHYNCAARCPRQLPCRNGGIIDSRSCNRCKCPSGFGGVYCETVAPSFSRGCGGVIAVEEAVRRFEITIRQNGATRDKQCVYHLQAPPGKRVLVNLLRVQGRCVEGCWIDGAEFKMQPDYRPLGYRFCCNLSVQRRMVSNTNIVPFMVNSRNGTMTLTFEYTYVSQRAHFDEEPTQPPTTTPAQVLESVDDEAAGVLTKIHSLHRSQ